MSITTEPSDSQVDASKQIAEALAFYYDDPVSFVEDIFSVVPDAWQQEALRAVANGENVSVVSGHGVGKSAFMAWLVVWYLCTRHMAKIPCTAPTAHQLSDILWAEIQTWLYQSPLKDLLVWTATRLSMAGMEGSWFAVARTSSTPEALAGFHAKNLMFLVDEASGVEDQVFNVVEGAITSEGAQLVMCSNGTQDHGYFFDSHNKNAGKFHCIHVSSEDSPRVSRNWVRDMEEKWGRDSNVFRVRVLGLFPKSTDDTFIPESLVARAIGRERLKITESSPREMGIDVARFGSDDTAIVIRIGGNVEYMFKKNGMALYTTLGYVLHFTRQFKITSIKVDDSGVGGGLTELMQNSKELREMGVTVVPVQFGGAGDAFHRDTSAMMWSHVRELLTKNEMMIPSVVAAYTLKDQLTKRRYSFNERGRIVLESKDHMKGRRVPSPDYADALVLAFWTGHNVPNAEYLPSLYDDNAKIYGTPARGGALHQGELALDRWGVV
jgi:phage terminase large subunit